MDSTICNRHDSRREVTNGSGDVHAIAELDQLPLGTEVNFYARISTQRRLSRNLDFILLRDHLSTVQGVLSNDCDASCEEAYKLSPESLILVTGTLRAPPEPIRSATHGHIEVYIHSIKVLSAAHQPRFSNYMPPETLRNRMTSRIIDLRNPANIALSRIRSLVVNKFRETLMNQNFVEIYTPKLQATASESGAATFKVDYFGRTAVLAQSPQLAKQMAISADLKRVFEIGPVFRAENSNTHRHLCEYTGLDIEMVIEHDYHEVIRIIDGFLKAIFKAVYELTAELAAIQQRWPSNEITYLAETLILDHSECLRMLRDDGRSVEKGDLSTANEIRLGQLVKEKYGTDYFILDKFPASIRPFYTAKDPDDPKNTRSFDIFIRGQEICTGGQRIHDLDELRDSMRAAGVSETGMEDYIAAFELGAPAHGGAGLGLERIITWMLELGDVRYSTLFYRDPKSLPETRPGLRHPEADTTKTKRDELPKIEQLVANYGDSSNSAWLDSRFQIWRHSTGAAVGYIPRNKLAIAIGNPLCDKAQYTDICTAFVKFATSDLRLTPVWMLVSYDIQLLLARKMNWRTLTCTEEQRVDTSKHNRQNSKKKRKINRAGVKMHETKADAMLIERANPAIDKWKSSKSGKQMHMTDVRPWDDIEHRRYFVAEKDDELLALVVLAQLSPHCGWQIKWALDFPGSINGAIDALLDYVLSNVTERLTFGVGPSENLSPGEGIRGIRAWLLAKTYHLTAQHLSLSHKSDFRSKFGISSDEVYICYPKGAIGPYNLGKMISVFSG